MTFHQLQPERDHPLLKQKVRWHRPLSSIVPPNRDTDVLGPAEKSNLLQKDILPTAKPSLKVRPYGDKEALNPLEGDAVHPRHILYSIFHSLRHIIATGVIRRPAAPVHTDDTWVLFLKILLTRYLFARTILTE